MKKIVKIVAFRVNSGNSGCDWRGDRFLNSNHLVTGQGKSSRDLRERNSWVPRGIPSCDWLKYVLKLAISIALSYNCTKIVDVLRRLFNCLLTDF